MAVQVQGADGEVCASHCDSSPCPTDVPAGTTAKPNCVLQDSSSGDKYCALTCFLGGCPAGSTCKMLGGIQGICLYPTSAATHDYKLVKPVQPDYVAMWKKFKADFDKSYDNGMDEEQKRFGIFKVNVDLIEATNAKNMSYKLGVNQFTDLTADEFAAQYTGLKKPEAPWGDLPYLGRDTYSGATLDASVDWTTKGAVTPVKNQGQCGSCWSFSTTGSLEGAWEIATGKLVSFSEQQFVDCDKADSGCNGGLMDTAFKYAEKNAICTEGSYSYTGRGGTCKASSCTVGIPKGGVTGYKDVAKDDEQALMEAIQKNPVSIAIEADKSAFQLYHSGILSARCGSNLDHGVLAVGYGTDGSQAYWKVKNSWGVTWGDKGYVRLARGKGGAGECGLLSGPPSYPVVSSRPVQDTITV